MTNLRGKLVFITGGSSGIGLETARQLTLLGSRVVLFARKEGPLNEACRYIERQAAASDDTLPQVSAMSMDVADNDGVKTVIKKAVETHGAPDILINCAGIGAADYFENISHETFDRVMTVNVYGTRNTISAVLPFMKEKGGGHIVNLSSAAGLIGMFGYTLYCTSKYALVGLSECLRAEFKRLNIKVTVVCPPEVNTPFITEEAKTIPPEARAIKSLAGRLTPEYTARTIVRSIRRNKFMVIPGVAAKFLIFWHRISNGRLTRTPSDWIAKLAARR